jgi:hypothetical protein
VVASVLADHALAAAEGTAAPGPVALIWRLEVVMGVQAGDEGTGPLPPALRAWSA